MKLTKRLAMHVRGVFFEGNWTSSSVRQNLADVSWIQANSKIYQFNTIAQLVYHINYYIEELSKVLNGAPLEAKDKLSFEGFPIKSSQDWDHLRTITFENAEVLISILERMPDKKLWNFIGEEEYGDFYYNVHGIIEHTHYHLGQISLIKKILFAETLFHKGN